MAIGEALSAVIAGKADEIKPALLKSIEAEMAKVNHKYVASHVPQVSTKDPVAQEPSRQVRCAVAATKGGKKGEAGAGGFELPRQDISSQISGCNSTISTGI